MAALAAGSLLAPSAFARAPALDEALRAADAPRAELRVAETATLPGGAVVSRFDQEVGGVPVQGAGAVVVDHMDAPPELLFDETRAGVDAPPGPALSRADALRLALDEVRVRRLHAAPSTRQVIVPGGDGTLAWEVEVTSDRPLGDFVVTLDAASGAILSHQNLIRFAAGRARIFVTNAVVENDGYEGLRDRKDRNSDLLTSLRSPVTLRNLNDGQDCLRGAWAKVRVSPKEKLVCDKTRDWSGVKRASNRFEGLMAYHHVDRVQEYVQSLGIPEEINAEPQKVVANDRMPRQLGQDNSYYSPRRDAIHTGRGGVDDAEDADLIAHEYGHAIQDDQGASFSGNQAGAMGEGFGDYLAAAYSTESVGFDPEWTPCIMEWDATSYDRDTPRSPGICLRRADDPDNRVTQEARCGASDIHCMGQIWSSALLDLRIELGEESGVNVMDRVVLASHFMAPQTFKEGAEALLEADETAYGGDHCAEIRAEMLERGFAPTTTCL